MLDLAIIVVYLLGMIGIGAWVYAKRQTSSRDGFFVANRTGSTLFVTGSLCATFIGASVVIGMTGRGFNMGLAGAWWLLVGAIGLFVLGFFFARKVRQVGRYTLPELIEEQYGSTAGVAASLLIVVAWIAIIAAQIVAVDAVLAVVLPFDISGWIIMTIATAVFVLYTMLGGQYSIIRTDFVQFGILAIGILVCLGLVLAKVGGIDGMTSALPGDLFSFPINEQFGWYELVALLVLTGATYVVGPDMYSRLFCARDGGVARSSALLAGLIAIPAAFAVILIGMGARVLYPDIGSAQAFPTVVEQLLPVGVSGLVAAALLAAIMSSADTVLLTTSTILSQDIIGRLKTGMTERASLAISRAGVVVIGILALVVALHKPGIIGSLLLAYTVFTSGVVIPVVAGFYRRRLKLNAVGAIAAIVGGGGTALAINRLEAAGWLTVDHLDLVGLGVCAVLLFGVSWIANSAGWVRQPS